MLTPGCQSKNEIIVKHLGVWLEKVFLFGPFYKKVCKLIFFLSIFANDKEKMNYAHF